MSETNPRREFLKRTLIGAGGLAALFGNVKFDSKDGIKVGKTAVSVGMSEAQATEIYEERSRLLDNWKSLRKVNNLDAWPEDEGKVEWHYLTERNANEGPLFIPRYLWHGCYNYTNEPAILIYHITNKYDGEDEDRLNPFIAGWNYEREVK